MKLGDPKANREELTADKSLQKRNFDKGFVVVNGSPDQNRTFKLDNNYTDDLDRIYPKDTVLTLLPHTGRVFFTYNEPVTPTPTPEPTPTPTPAPTKPSINITSPADGIVVLDSSVTVSYTVDGESKTKVFSGLKVGDNQLNITESNKSDANVTSTVSIKVVYKESITLRKDNYANGWNMVAFPYIKDSFTGGTLPSTFKIRKYNPSTNAYDNLEGTNTPLTSGLGYWVKIDDINKIDNFRYISDKASSKTIAVSKGWNFLGNPFDSNLPLANLSIKYKDGATRSYAEAIERREVAGYVWSYESRADPKQYYFVAIDPDRYRTTAHKETFISPLRGFWLIVKSEEVSQIIMNK